MTHPLLPFTIHLQSESFFQKPQGIEHHQRSRSGIGRDCRPHGRPTEQREDQEHALHAECKRDVLSNDGKSPAGMAYKPG